MKLSYTETDYINQCMKRYDIKYQEIYDEIKDHMVSAIENARAAGDERKIAIIYDELMEAHFPGYLAFQNISKEYDKAYSKKISSAICKNLKGQINAGSILAIVLLIILAFYIPRTKAIAFVFYICLCVTASVPIFYIGLKTRKMNLDDGKRSMVQNHINRRASFLILIIYVFLGFVNLIADAYNLPALKLTNYPPVILMSMLCAFILYGLSIMQLCRQEIKVPMLNTNNLTE